MSVQERRRAKFEQTVINRMKEGGYLEVEIRVECLTRDGDGYYDGSVNTYWHFWNAALDGVVVQMPNRHNYSNPDAAGAAILDIATAIKTAGVQVQP